MNEKGKDVLLSIGASLVCIVIGLVVGLLILCCINGENAVDGFSRILQGGFYLKPKGIGSEITQAAPLIMTGLSVAFAFKTGLFNIGAAGQYTVGIFGALYSAIILGLPWYLCLLVRILCRSYRTRLTRSVLARLHLYMVVTMLWIVITAGIV